jgi:hypothetical protein
MNTEDRQKIMKSPKRYLHVGLLLVAVLLSSISVLGQGPLSRLFAVPAGFYEVKRAPF